MESALPEISPLLPLCIAAVLTATMTVVRSVKVRTPLVEVYYHNQEHPNSVSLRRTHAVSTAWFFFGSTTMMGVFLLRYLAYDEPFGFAMPAYVRLTGNLQLEPITFAVTLGILTIPFVVRKYRRQKAAVISVFAALVASNILLSSISLHG
jgi:hypothetical protein